MSLEHDCAVPSQNRFLKDVDRCAGYLFALVVVIHSYSALVTKAVNDLSAFCLVLESSSHSRSLFEGIHDE